MLGIAAIRSISAISGRLSAAGAYSEMNRAAMTAQGTATSSAMTAIRMPLGRMEPMPKWPSPTSQVPVLKKLQPAWR